MAPPRPAIEDRVSPLLIGFALVGAGLVAGGAGFTVLYVCRQGEDCHSDATTAVGWALAAPGVPPVVIGAVFIGIGLSDDDKKASTSRIKVAAGMLPGGATGGFSMAF